MATDPKRAPLRVNSRLSIPAAELTYEHARSGGPGGQRVNKAATKVVLRFSVARSPSLGERRRALLSARLERRLTREGEIVLHASRFRERSRNEADARERLATLLRGALAPRPVRRATRKPRSADRRRLEEKRRRSDRKRARRPQEDG